MALGINTNAASLTAQHNLTSNSSTLSTSISRLSSGLRINSAKDDAAGLAIASRFTSQIRGLNQAARNANDAISLSQTAEGALGSISDNLQRVRELAVQAANATNSASDRAALNAEATQLIAEVDRVATTTQFNGVNLLDGTFSGQSFQVGANNGQTITLSSLSSARGAALGVGSGSSYSTSVTGAVSTTGALAAGALSINGYAVGAASSDGVSFANGSASAIAKAAAINAISSQTGVTASVAATAVAGTTVTKADTALSAGDVIINGVDIGAVAAASGAATANGVAERGSSISAAINAKSAQTGVTATYNSTTGAVALSAADGRNITVTTTATATAASTGLGSGGATTVTSLAAISLSSSSSAGITISNNTAGAAATAGLTVGYTAATATVGAGVSSINLSTAAGAQAALTTLDSAIQNINSSRATLGALQNRFSSTIANLGTTANNLTESRGRIQDTDYAAETASLSKAQILQQAGTAVLAQANQLPKDVLSLLRG